LQNGFKRPKEEESVYRAMQLLQKGLLLKKEKWYKIYIQVGPRH